MKKLVSKTIEQQNRLLEELKIKPVTTFEARAYLDIPHPAARVRELRKQGYPIQTIRSKKETSRGVHLHVAEYWLTGG